MTSKTIYAHLRENCDIIQSQLNSGMTTKQISDHHGVSVSFVKTLICTQQLKRKKYENTLARKQI
jgi:hypothetical protein